MKLEFGCGDNPKKKDFIGVDIRKFPNVQYVCNAWEISDQIEAETVSEIFSRHFFEHLTFKQGSLTLNAWHKILEPDGKLEIIVPDMEFHIKQWLNSKRKIIIKAKTGETEEEWALRGFWGGQRGDLMDTWDIHKSGYDFNLLKDLLIKHQFVKVKRIVKMAKNLHVVCYKP